MSELILFEKIDKVGKITFNRPDKYNSMVEGIALPMIEYLEVCARDNDIRVVYLTGSGKAFCAGQDLKEATDPVANRPLDHFVANHFNPIIRSITNLQKPVVAAVNGVAAGAGANIALACDIVVAKESASFIQAFSAIGLIPDSGGTHTLQRLVGYQRALAITMLGDKIGAAEAERMGMIYKYFSDEAFEEKSWAIAERLSHMATQGLALTKIAYQKGKTATLSESLEIERELQLRASNTTDFKEGTSAFLEKKKTNILRSMKVAVIGAGTMGSGIAQVAATADCKVVLYDLNQEVLEKSKAKLEKVLLRLIEKQRINAPRKESIQANISYSTNLDDLADSDLVIEAIVENPGIKKKVFTQVEALVSGSCIIASNTSSLSITDLAACLDKPDRFIGIHFFNPAPLMKLVEIIPALQTKSAVTQKVKDTIDNWGKFTVLAKDTPGFIVNKVARPFYSEAIRIYEEGIADFATIDWAMKDIAGFRMGPFELMDFIGNDVNYIVTETVWKSFYFDPRYKPALTQKKLSEAGYHGRKVGRGYYNYDPESILPMANKDTELGQIISFRIIIMLINEATDTLYLNIASREDIETAMIKGVNYPKGLLAWADEIGIQNVVDSIDELYSEYHEDRYRCSPLLRKMGRENKLFQ